MNSVIDDIKQAFNSNHNSSVKIILVNLFVFMGIGIFKLLLSLSPSTQGAVNAVEENLLLNASVLSFFQHPWGLLTFGFMQESLMQLIFNCLTLFYFGLLIQDFLGTKKLMSVYIMGYIFAGIFYMLMFGLIANTNVEIAMSPVVAGTTAAVYAVMFATICLLPDYEFYFFRLFYIKIKYLVVGFLILSFFLSKSYALLNLGGAIFGYLYIKLLRTGIDLGSPVEAVGDWISRISGGNSSNVSPPSPPKTKKYSRSTVSVGNTSKGVYDYDAEDSLPAQPEIDALLDKISQSGYDSLSKEEKQRLYIASQSNDLKT